MLEQLLIFFAIAIGFFSLGFFLGAKILKTNQEFDGIMTIDNSDPDKDTIRLQLDEDPEEKDVYILQVRKSHINQRV